MDRPHPDNANSESESNETTTSTRGRHHCDYTLTIERLFVSKGSKNYLKKISLLRKLACGLCTSITNQLPDPAGLPNNEMNFIDKCSTATKRNHMKTCCF